jgi:hypothetical protein
VFIANDFIMFLSALVSRYDLDGALEVDLRDEGGPLVRHGPYADGMPWSRYAAGGWVETAFDWGARIVNRAHESRRDLPVLRYLQTWPRDLISTLYPVWYAQSSVMQICALHPAARDLARSNLVLLWLAAARYAEDASWRTRLPEVFGMPQRELLAAVLDRPVVRQAQVRFLRKIVLMAGTRATLGQIQRMAADEELVMSFRHWIRLPSGLVQLADGPLLRHLHWLRETLAGTDNRWLLGQILDHRLDLLRDTSRMLEGYHRRAAERVVAYACRDWAGVQRLHDVLVDLGAGDDDTDLDPALSFGQPPIPSDEQFQAITTVGELVREGKLMRHCVATRAEDVLAGDCYIYRVDVDGERATLQVGIEGNRLIIDEFRLCGNGEPSPGAWRATREWLDRAAAQRAGTRRSPKE